MLRSEPRAAAARLRARLETAPPELAGELEEQLVEALAYSDDDADEYLSAAGRGRARTAARARRAPRRRGSTMRRRRLASHARAELARGAPGSERPALVHRHARARGARARTSSARRALRTRVFARIGVERFAALWAIEALLAVEAAPEAAGAARAMTDLTNRSGSRASAGAAAWLEARWERRFGNLRRAEDLARLSIELAGDQLIAGDGGGEHADRRAARPRRRRRRPRGRRRAARPGPDGRDLRPVRHPGPAAADRGPRRGGARAARPQEAADGARRWLVGIREDNHILRVRALAALGRDDEARALAEREIAAAQARGARGAEAIA